MGGPEWLQGLWGPQKQGTRVVGSSGQGQCCTYTCLAVELATDVCMVAEAGYRYLHGGRSCLQAHTHWQGPQPVAGAGANCGPMSSNGTLAVSGHSCGCRG